MRAIGHEFNLKGLAISDKILYWAIQTFSSGSLKYQWNTLVARLEQNSSLLLSKLTK